jgi:protein-S-isoprenylcysteine O-methyltransferase Ste14
MLWFFKSFFPVLWIAFLLYWRIKAAGTKTTQRSEPDAADIVRALVFLIVIVLLSLPRIRLLPWLYRPLCTSDIWSFSIGAAVTVMGLLFAVWARQYLASNWSSAVTIKQGHELITTGPYAMVRHPIYTGILTGFIGTAIALGQVRGVIGFVLIFIVLWAKLRKEEEWMRSQFGETYATYADQTTALVPYLL